MTSAMAAKMTSNAYPSSAAARFVREEGVSARGSFGTTRKGAHVLAKDVSKVHLKEYALWPDCKNRLII